MTEARLELVGGEQLRRAMRDPEFVRGPATSFIRSAAFEILGHAQQNAPSNVGRLRNSLTVSMGSGVHVHGGAAADGSVSARVGTNLQYAKPVEFGSRPHWAPIAPLEFWVRRKLRPPSNRVRGIAFAVQRKIARVGTKAQPYLEPAIGQSKGFIESALRRLGEEIERRWSSR